MTAVHTRSLVGFVLALVGAFSPLGALAKPGKMLPSQVVLSQPFTDTVAQMQARDRLQPAAPGGAAQAIAAPRHDFPPLIEPKRSGSSRPAKTQTQVQTASSFELTADAPQTLSTSFVATSMHDEAFELGSYSWPPDTMGAVGPAHFVEAINGAVAIYDKTGSLVSRVSLTSFFSVTINSVIYPRNGSFDPRIIYDRRSGRWMAIALERGAVSGKDNDVLLAVSATSNPTGTWNKYLIPIGEPDTSSPTKTYFSDFDTLGTDDNGVYVSVRIFISTGGSYAKIAAIPKSEVLTAGTATVSVFSDITDMYSTPQPAHNLDAVGATDRAWFVSASSSVYANVNYRRLTWSGSTPSLDGSASVLTTPAFSAVLDAPASGSPTDINCGDMRLQMAVIRDGSLWTCRQIGLNSSGGSSAADRTGCEWLQLNVTGFTPTLTQSGRVYDPAASNPRYYFYPSIMPNGQGHAVMGFSGVAAGEFVGAYYTGRLGGDTAGTMGAVTLIKAGEAAYDRVSSGRNRWGDYSYTSLDPNDDMSIWTIQEYSKTSATYVDSNWGTWVAKTLAPPPVTPASASASVAWGFSGVNVTITGTSVSGSGFYDPGSGFANRIAGAVSGGVTVNSITYNGPTSVTLNLDTTAATTGAQNVTITNPDGQSRTGTSILTITPNFYSWQNGKFTAGELLDENVSGPNAVYGLDGLTNLVKYALGLDPKTDITSGLPEVTTTATDWVYTYTRPQAADRPDLTYTVEVSTGLVSWTTAGVTHTMASTAGGIDTWTATYPLASATNVFFRLKVTQL